MTRILHFIIVFSIFCTTCFLCGYYTLQGGFLRLPFVADFFGGSDVVKYTKRANLSRIKISTTAPTWFAVLAGKTFAGKALYSVRTFFGVSSLDIVGKATSQPNGPNIALDGDTENINDGSLCTTNPLNKLKNAESLEMRSKSTA